MAKGLSAAKAKKILQDGYVKGKPLTAKQKKYFGAIASGATPLKAIDGAGIDKAQWGKILKWGKELYDSAKGIDKITDVKKLLPNVSKLNPNRFEPNPNNFYHRSQNYKDNILGDQLVPWLQGNPELAAELTKKIPGKFNLFKTKSKYDELYWSKGTPLDGRYYTKQSYPGPYVWEMPSSMKSINKVNGKVKAFNDNLGSYKVNTEPLKVSDAKLYAEHWWKGYKQIDPLKKQNGGWLDKFGMGGNLPGASGMMYSRNSGSSAMSPPNLTKAQNGNFGGVNTDIRDTSGEPVYETINPGDSNYDAKYRETYNAGAFASMPNPLDEVVVYSGVDYEKYPYYNDLSAEQREYFNDPGAIGRGVRRAAYTKRGLAEDTYDVVNPIMYGMLGVAGGMMAGPSVATLGRAAAPYVSRYALNPIQKALNYKPLGGPVSIGNVVDAGSAAYAGYATPEAYDKFKENPSWDTGLDLALTSMDLIPFSEIFTGGKNIKNLYNKGKNLFTKTPTPDVSNAIDASIDPGIRKSLANLNDKLGLVDTPSAQIRASEKFNKDWFNNPETIRRVEEMLNQPSTLRSSMSEIEILQDINMYNTMLDKTPNLPANLQAKIKDNLKDLNAGLAKRNLETVQQKGRFTEVFDENNLNHQEMALHYDENPGTLGLYKGRTNQASVNLERIKEKAKDVGSVITHEDLHAITAGRKGYTDEAKDILNSAIDEDSAEWWLNKINTTKDQKTRQDLIDRLEYLARPQEIHARVHELRKAFNLKPGQEVTPSKIEAIMTKGLKGETPVDEEFFRLLGDKENFRKIFNKLPAYIPAAVGLGAASQNKNGGKTPKAQVGDKVAAIASQMEANEEDGGRPPLGVVDHIRALFDEEGLCRDNTCVQTVKDFYSKAGVKAMPKDVYNNREFLKNFKEYGFEEILDQKNLQPGDVLQYYYGPDSEDVKEDPSYLNFPYHMGVYVNPGEYIGDGDSKAPIQRKNMYTGTKDGKEYKKDPFRAFRYIKQNKNGGWLDKFQEGGVIEDDRGQWAHPGKITKINSNNITMKGVNYPVLGVSDTGDTKMMQPGVDNYKYDGNSVTEYPMAQEGAGVNKEGVKQYKWFKNYMRSPKYKERLKKEFPDYSDNQIGQEVKSRLENVMQTRVGFLPRSSEISTGVGDTQGVYDADEYPGAIMLRPEYSASTSDALFKPGNYLSGYNTIPLHEWSHAADDGGNRMPQSTTDLMLSKMKENPLGISKDKYYYTRPTEYLGRMQPLRYLMQQEGLYDAGAQDFTKEDLENAKQNKTIKNNQHFQDLMENVKSDEDFIELMNKVASVDNSRSEYPMAQDGIKTKAPDPTPQINFMKDWASSAMHNKMLDASSSSDKFKNKVRSARSNFDDVTIGMFDDPGYLGLYSNSNIRMNPSLLEEAPIGNGYNSVLTHELSHYTDDVNPSSSHFKGYNIPLSDQKLIKDYSKKGVKRAKAEEKELNKLLKSENMNPNSKDVIKDRVKRLKYLGDPTETRSRINATRYFYENDKNFGRSSERNIDKNLPSIFDSEVTPDMIKVMQESGQYKQLQELYTDDQILEMFNTISDNSKSSDPSNMAYAKEGESLVALDQLTNFTNYNTPQPGGWLDKY